MHVDIARSALLRWPTVYVCLCRGLTERDVRRSARDGNTTAEALIADLKLDDPGCCGRCRRNVQQFVLLATEEQLRQAVPDPA